MGMLGHPLAHHLFVSTLTINQPFTTNQRSLTFSKISKSPASTHFNHNHQSVLTLLCWPTLNPNQCSLEVIKNFLIHSAHMIVTWPFPKFSNQCSHDSHVNISKFSEHPVAMWQFQNFLNTQWSCEHLKIFFLCTHL